MALHITQSHNPGLNNHNKIKLPLEKIRVFIAHVKHKNHTLKVCISWLCSFHALTITTLNIQQTYMYMYMHIASPHHPPMGAGPPSTQQTHLDGLGLPPPLPCGGHSLVHQGIGLGEGLLPTHLLHHLHYLLGQNMQFFTCTVEQNHKGKVGVA